MWWMQLCYIMSAEVKVRLTAVGSALSVSHVYLKMWIAHTFRDLLKQRFLDFLELCRLDDVENLLNFPQEHDLMISKEMQEMQEVEWGATQWGCKLTA